MHSNEIKVFAHEELSHLMVITACHPWGRTERWRMRGMRVIWGEL